MPPSQLKAIEAGISTYDSGSGDDAVELAVLVHLPAIPGPDIQVGDVHFAKEWHYNEDHHGDHDQEVLPVWAWPLPEGCDQRILDVVRAECVATL